MTALPKLTVLEQRMPWRSPTSEKLMQCVPICEMNPTLPASPAGCAPEGRPPPRAPRLRAPPLQPYPLLRLRLREAGGEQRDRADALRDAVGDDAGRYLARHGAQHVVDLFRDVEEAGVVRDAELLDAGDLVGGDLDGGELALEGAHGAQPQVAQRPLVTDDGDGARGEGAVKPCLDIAAGLGAGHPPTLDPAGPPFAGRQG